jgi:hypothetical protein
LEISNIILSVVYILNFITLLSLPGTLEEKFDVLNGLRDCEAKSFCIFYFEKGAHKSG